MAELMSIGRFARQAGLSVGALRHYAELGLIVPARVDPDSGYRYYTPDQVPTAQLVAALRDLEVPLGRIRTMLGASPAELRRRLAGHRTRIDADIWRLQRIAHRLRMIIDNEEDPMPHPAFVLDPDDERRLAATLFNRVWELLEKPDRSTADDDEMLHATHASRHHWGQVGQPVNFARGEWQCSRVYAVLGRAEPALHHGRRCLELAEAHDLGPFDVGCGHEALARAYRVAGDREASARHVADGRVQADKLTDPEERELLSADLDSV
ncbi:MAG TPA: helix-turn-helix domain-containing protein [Micromonosporaceae bacterium]|nr:helix-turn-helix domain-containing protein [Micromonosporaceae bacterium]